ncbi:protein HGV2-like [Rhopalosiphum maidis]|uniref:protein HGV2-like n=1 Tax=Rhopalosiphum maidis TaxID=43146 RepID=UPI000EFE3869|nr:protein HGV2-like [Rhopalosiphum maidis]XP_026815359.1 protein HGV2-like [Rhopalosiphum maidis]
MPSEVVQKEAEIGVEEKDIIEKIDTKTETKENGSQETKTDEIQTIDKSEESKINEEELSESENKENEEPTAEDIELQKKRAEQLLTDGKRHLIIKDFQVAVDVLSEACSLFGTIYSELDEKCAEAYFNYGCALLELSKNQISPVGLEEKDEEENDDETSTEEMDSNNVTNEDNKVSITDVINEVEKEETDNVDDNKSTEKKENLPEETLVDVKENEVGEEQSIEKENLSVDEGEKPDEEDVGEDDVNDLQIAWEMLDLAKVIYKNKDTEESKLKLAEVLMKCGEVSIEDEKFDTAIQDMTESLEIRRLLLPEDSRIIAETLFQLGIAQELGGSGEQAIELLSEAVTVLNHKIKTLENMNNDSDIIKAEIAEVKSIIPEIQEKIVDIKERKKAAVSALLAAVGASNLATTNGETSSTIKQASNISHLVRKRPKQEETADAAPNKVPKLEESSNVKQ